MATNLATPNAEEQLRILAEEEQTLQFPDFSNTTALALGNKAVELATKEKLPVAILIRRNGQRLFQAALPGTGIDNDSWLDRKSRLVDHLGHSSYHMRLLAASKGSTVEEMYYLDSSRFAAHGGAFPISLAGTGIIGTITISGLDQQEDHHFAVRTVREFLSEQR